MVVDDVFVNAYNEDDIRRWFEFTFDDKTRHALTLDEGQNNFRTWVSKGFAWTFVGWLLPEDPGRRSFDEYGSETEQIIKKYVEEKRSEYDHERSEYGQRVDAQQLVDAVKAHAREHYTDGGWDVVVEAWEDKAILDLLYTSNATTAAEAIAAFLPLVEVWADRQADAKNSAF